MHFWVANLLLFLFFIFFTPTVLAGEQFITIVNPVREGFLSNSQKQWEIIKNKNLPATWLLRPDILQDKESLGFFKSLPSSQELGLFMEITPKWASDANISYHQSQNWHSAGSVFLTGYSVDERHKLIDIAFEKFKQEFLVYPKSVGAWWIDAGSLTYMREKYGIVANMDVADQYSTDNYQVWGQYFSTPFYPAKRNALVPASGEGQKIGVVTLQWATRDPFNSFGNGVLDSTYSVQVNDYANKKFHNLDTSYFKKLLGIYLDNSLNEFGQVTIGLENDFSWEEFGEEYKNQIDEVYIRLQKGAKVLTVSNFAESYIRLFPQVSPPQIIFATDPLDSGGKVMWYQDTKYRVGWFYNQTGSVIRDLRLFRESIDEPCLEKACNELNLAMQETKNLDEVTFGDSWVIDEGKISDINLRKLINGVEISYKNQGGFLRTITFLPNDIAVDGSNLPIQIRIDQAINASRNLPKIEGQYNFKLMNPIGILLNQGKNLIIFILFSLIFFFVPGRMILQKTKLSVNQKFVLSWPIGISFFTLLSFSLIFFNIFWLIIFLPIISIVILRQKIFPLVLWTKMLWWPTLTFFTGSFVWLLVSVKNGLLYDFGFGFWGPTGHDGVWHLSIIESLKKGLPPENSIFAGEILKNYHYFYDLLLATTSNITNISAVDLYFRFFPLLISLSVGAVAYILAKEWFGSKKAALTSIFFIYFGGSFGWVVSFLRDRSLGGETLFWSQQGISTLINPPFAISLLIFLSGLILFQKITSQKQYNWFSILPFIILWGSLIEFKAYAGVLILAALAVVTLYELIKKNWGILKLSLPVVALSLLVFLPNNSESASLLVFSPLWLIHSMIDFPDRLNWARLALTRTAGFETGNWFKILGAEGLALTIFLLGNLGARFLGFLSFKNFLPLNSFNLFIICFTYLSLVIPLLFIQTGANFNTIQFFYYFLLIFNFLAASALAKFNKVIILIIFILTIPTTWDTLRNYLPARPPAMVSSYEIEALNFLKNQQQGIVLSYFFDKKLRDRFVEPKPLFAYESTPYVSAFSGKPEFISDTVNLEILGIDYKGRTQTQKDILAAREPEVFKKMLKENKISYLYLPKFFKFAIDNELYGIKRIFENSEVEIYRVL